MDDSKQISRSKEELRSVVKIQDNFKQRHKINFVLEKCEKTINTIGKIERKEHVENKLEIETELLE
jgi:hypothetical protein